MKKYSNMRFLSIENKVPKDKIDAVQGIIKSTILQAEECQKLFKAEMDVKRSISFVIDCQIEFKEG